MTTWTCRAGSACRAVLCNSKPVNEENNISKKEKLVVKAYIPADPGPYPQDKAKQNAVRFTSTQVFYLSVSLSLCILI